MVSIPELTQFDKAKSIILYFPPKGTEGFAILVVRAPSLLPCPPARSIATHSFLANFINFTSFVVYIIFIFLF